MQGSQQSHISGSKRPLTRVSYLVVVTIVLSFLFRGAPIELNDAHLALAVFALPNYRDTLAIDSKLTVIPLSGAHVVRHAMERMFASLGLEFTTGGGSFGTWFQQDPLLIELPKDLAR